MIKLFVLADDLTGALDTAVQFSAHGVTTRVVIDEHFDFSQANIEDSVVVMSIPTRHLSANLAYEKVYNVTKRAIHAGIPYLFKKTDSALRGNVASELSAMMKAAGSERLDFLPAYPALRRTTRDGIQFLDDQPIHNTVFGNDLFEPVTQSYIPDIIARQSQVTSKVIRLGENVPSLNGEVINIYDAETDADLLDTVSQLYHKGLLRVMAGCAGLAGVLHMVLPLSSGSYQYSAMNKKLFVVCGSINPITRKQLEYAEKQGFNRVTLSAQEKNSRSAITDHLLSHLINLSHKDAPCILDIMEDNEMEHRHDQGHLSGDIREQAAGNLGYLVSQLWKKGLRATLMITGGDTLLAVLQHMNCQAIHTIRELRPGVVLSECRCDDMLVPVISKSGGFGDSTLLTDLALVLENTKGGN